MSKVVCGVYKITSKIHPDRAYIGSSNYIYDRWSGHKVTLFKGKHNPIMQAHFNKYGWDDFIFSIIELCSKDILIEKEQFYLDNDPLNGYLNARKVAENCTGLKQSAETIAKRVAKTKGQKRTFTESHLFNMRIAIKKERATRIGKPSPKKGKKYGKNKKKPVYTEESLMVIKGPKTKEHRDAVKRSWIKRKEEGKITPKNEKGVFIKVAKLPLV